MGGGGEGGGFSIKGVSSSDEAGGSKRKAGCPGRAWTRHALVDKNREKNGRGFDTRNIYFGGLL